MSKISENKALEAYPNALIGNLDNLKKDGFIKGYDQAMQDLLTKACEWLHHNTMRELVLDSESTELIEDFVDDFKNYIQHAEI